MVCLIKKEDKNISVVILESHIICLEIQKNATSKKLYLISCYCYPFFYYCTL